jgi:predicted PurR-regulated permease PerM
MTSADSSTVDKQFLANAMASAIQIGAVLLLLLWCYSIVAPFVSIVVWGVVISIAIYPLHLQLGARLGGKTKLSSTLLVLVGLLIIVGPTWILAESTIDGYRHVAAELGDGTVSIPPPAATVADWPVIGDKVYEIWSGAATNLEATLNQFEPQLVAAGKRAVSMAGGTVVGVLQFVISIIIAGTLLMSAEGGHRASRNIAASLVGPDRGDALTNLSILTIRSVFKGVLGVAVIQALAAAIGLLIIGVPGAGVWAGVVLVLAIVQLPPILCLGPIAFWYFSVAEPVPATIFLVFSIIVSFSDAALKPMLLGRGVDTPMLVILIGAIGGALTAGIIGLFIGPVVLALGYELLTAWMAPDAAQAADA